MAGLIYKELWHDKKTRAWSSDEGWLWVLCISFTEDHLDHGLLISPAELGVIAELNEIPAATIESLVDNHGLNRVEGGYEVHNYRQRGKLRRKRAKAGRLGGVAKGQANGVATDVAKPLANALALTPSKLRGVGSGVVERNEKVVARGLCDLLAELMLANGCKVPDPIPANWVRDMDALLRLDNRIADEVAGVLRWSQQDSFWKTNIHSPAKLRMQYDKLRLKMQAPVVTTRANRGVAAGQDWADLAENLKASGL